MHGKGHLKFKNAEEYLGDFLDNKADGIGKYIYVYKR
tara:strand:- start:300 stop:410 length:111 start_codon:yes stop_codon:yes gene_type:complete